MRPESTAASHAQLLCRAAEASFVVCAVRTEFAKSAVDLDKLVRCEQRHPRIVHRHVLDCAAHDEDMRVRI